ncbi:MAG TPA: hypothetical protein VJO35_14945 [Terriglobales bacterium]|nr:hypothetical protein [Terriglobales bacterium]
MATKQVRRSVTLPGRVARQVDAIANRRRLSDNRVLVELIELGIEANKQKEKAFFELARKFRAPENPAEAKRLGDELGFLVFGNLMSASSLTSGSGDYSAENLKRKISECLALLPNDPQADADPDFAADIETAVGTHREPLKPPAWD